MTSTKKIVRNLAGVIGGMSLALAAPAQGLVAAPVFRAAAVLHSATDVDSLSPAPEISSSTAGMNVASAGPAAESVSLPDAPSAVLRASYVGFDPAAGGGQNAHTMVAPRYTVVIPAGWTAQPINAGDKVVLGVRDAVDPFSLIGIVLSAGYSHVTNGQPNYGTNGKAFGKRLGAIAVRDTTDTIFSESVFAPIFHQDPRYYVMGRGHSFIKRLAYAATRPVITRTDGGHETINASELAGYASASALADAYFPQINRNFKDTASDFGGGLGGAALGFIVSEFYHDFAVAIHLKHDD